MVLRLLHRARTALLLLTAVPGIAAAAPPACTGHDMLAQMQSEDPAAYARVMSAAAATSNARHLLWRIEGKGAQPSYLFGTVHLSDERVTTLSPRVREAIGASTKIALEVADISPEGVGVAMASMGGLVRFRDGSSLDKLLTPEEFETARTALAPTGVPASALRTLRPWVVTLSLAVTQCERSRVAAGLLPLDLRIAQLAKQRRIPVVGLETLEGQLRALAAVPAEDQVALLKVTLAYYDRSDDMMETMLRRYVSREIGAMWPFQLELARKAGFAPETFTAFKHQMVGVRNGTMRNSALPLLEEGGVFIAVGALHLPGQEGLVAQLAEAGYRLIPIE